MSINNRCCFIYVVSYSKLYQCTILSLHFQTCLTHMGCIAESMWLCKSDAYSSPGKHSPPIVYTRTGVDGFNKDEHWIWLWPTDIKISLDLANRDYGASLPQREATACSMPCDPLHSISCGRTGPTDRAVCVGLRHGLRDTQMVMRGCQERC